MQPEVARWYLETTTAGYEITDAWEEFAIRLKGDGPSKNTVAVYRSGVWAWPSTPP